MSRSPVDKIASQSKPQGQDGVWDYIRNAGIFTVSEISKETDIHRKTITDYIKRLVAGGYVEEYGIDFETTKRFKLVRDGGLHAPRLKKDGSPVTQGGGVRNMWRSMRQMGTFTPIDLVSLSNTDSVTVTENTAKSYCSMLLKAKYLKVVQKAVPGKRPATYRFVRNTGPLPPQIQRVKQVFDPNLNQVTYYPEAAL